MEFHTGQTVHKNNFRCLIKSEELWLYITGFSGTNSLTWVFYIHLMKTYHRIIQNNCDGQSFLEEPSHQTNQQASELLKGKSNLAKNKGCLCLWQKHLAKCESLKSYSSFQGAQSSLQCHVPVGCNRAGSKPGSSPAAAAQGAQHELQGHAKAHPWLARLCWALFCHSGGTDNQLSKFKASLDIPMSYWYHSSCCIVEIYFLSCSSPFVSLEHDELEAKKAKLH